MKAASLRVSVHPRTTSFEVSSKFMPLSSLMIMPIRRRILRMRHGRAAGLVWCFSRLGLGAYTSTYRLIIIIIITITITITITRWFWKRKFEFEASRWWWWCAQYPREKGLIIMYTMAPVTTSCDMRRLPCSIPTNVFSIPEHEHEHWDWGSSNVFLPTPP